MGSVIALLLLAIASIVIVGVSTPAADRMAESVQAVDGVRAQFAVDAGISVLRAAIGAGEAPQIPASLASNYDVTFVRLQSGDTSTRYRVEGSVSGATRTVDVACEAQPSGDDVVTLEWYDRALYSPFDPYIP